MLKPVGFTGYQTDAGERENVRDPSQGITRAKMVATIIEIKWRKDDLRRLRTQYFKHVHL